MKVILFGATGMVGQGVLLECLKDDSVERILAVVRSPIQQQHAKLSMLICQDFYDYSPVLKDLTGYDACFFCVGVSSAGRTEQDYHRMTFDLTKAAAEALASVNSGMTFIYVSGAGTDSTGQGRVMWARVKGKTENALLGLPFKASYMFRPALIQPMHGIVSKTKWYRALYAVSGPLFPILSRFFPNYVTTTERVGRAMIRVADKGFGRPYLECQDINRIAQS
jgi:uncharacterized protein YbjT (DUF2867 family)